MSRSRARPMIEESRLGIHRPPAIYCREFWRRWASAREASRPRLRRGKVLGMLSVLGAIGGNG